LIDLGVLVGDMQWILGGDFNIILSLEENLGGTRILDNDNEGFQKLIDALHLVDMENINGISTSSNQQSGSHQVVCKLDKFLISEPLMLHDLLMEVSILPRYGFDHWPIQLWIDFISSPQSKPFWFEKFWLSNLDF